MTRIRQTKPEVIMYGATVAYIVVFCSLSILQHLSFHTGYDLAGAMQGLWALAFGENQVNTLWGTHSWLNHAYVLSLPVAPLYRLLPSAYVLLLLQTVALALGAPVVYRLALEKTGSPPLGIAMALGYLIYPPLHFANLFDFHWDAFAPLFLLLTLYWVDKSVPPTLLGAVLAMACKENIALTVFALGVYIALRGNDHQQHRDRRAPRFSLRGAALCVLSVLWLLTVIGVLVPALSGGRPTPHIAYWAAYGDTPAEVLRFVLTHPLQTAHILLIEHGGLKYLFKVSLFLCFLPLLSPDVLLIALPSFCLRFLSTFEPHHNIYFQFSLPETAIVFYAAIVSVERLLRWRRRLSFLRKNRRQLLSALSAAFFVCLATTSALFGPFRGRGQYRSVSTRFAFTERSRVLREVCRQIPPDAGVSASYLLTPHLANRKIIYMFPNPYQRSHWSGMPGEPDYGKFTVSTEPQVHLERGREVEWVVIDKESLPSSPHHPARQILAGLVQSQQFEVVRDDPFALVLRRIAQG